MQPGASPITFKEFLIRNNYLVRIQHPRETLEISAAAFSPLIFAGCQQIRSQLLPDIPDRKIPHKEYAEDFYRIITAQFSPVDQFQIEKAFKYAGFLHEHKRRLSGHPYIQHPLETFKICLQELEIKDPNILSAALLHDVLEDSETTPKMLEAEFGPDIAGMVDGVSKLEKEKESLFKLFSAIAQDPRIAIIKLADRLHNLKTVAYLTRRSPLQPRNYAAETLDIFVPLAARLGIWKIKQELEDLCFQITQPEIYLKILEAIEISQKQAGGLEKRISDSIKTAYQLQTQTGALSIHLNPKSIYETYLNDGLNLIMIVLSKEDCYLALKIVHDLFDHHPEQIRDLIGNQRENLYRSLHTTILEEKTIRILIRTPEMERTAKLGIAAHLNDARLMRNLTVELQNQLAGASAEEVKDKIEETFGISKRIFVFTPSGSTFNLPEGATPIDLAARISYHTLIYADSCRIKGGLTVQLNYKLLHDRTVDIITAATPRAELIWLKWAKTTAAIRMLKSYFKETGRAACLKRGKESLAEAAEKKYLKMEDLENSSLFKKNFSKFMKTFVGKSGAKEIQIKSELENVNHFGDLYYCLGRGEIFADEIVEEFLKVNCNKNKKTRPFKVGFRIISAKRIGIKICEIADHIDIDSEGTDTVIDNKYIYFRRFWLEYEIDRVRLQNAFSSIKDAKIEILEEV